MREIALRLPDGGVSEVVLQEPALGRGGEGAVFGIIGPSPGSGPMVVKIYHPSDQAKAVRRAAKVAAMLQRPPASTAICWPLAEAWEPGGDVAIGFAMARLDLAAHRTWGELAHAADRRASAPLFSVRYGLVAARNLLVALSALHRAGHVLGDVNESNLLVRADATVHIVDADSAQVRLGDELWRCEVGKPEFCAPELAGRALRDVDRTQGTDAFAAAILIYQMLVGGAHPSDGIPFDLGEEPPTVTERLAHGWLPGLGRVDGCPLQPIPRVPAAAIPSRVALLLVGALEPRPLARRSLAELLAGIDDVGAHLVDCSSNPLHAYDARDNRCGWCIHAASGQPDPWAPAASRGGGQQTMPALRFSAPGAAPPSRRSPSTPPTGAGHGVLTSSAMSGALPTGTISQQLVALSQLAGAPVAPATSGRRTLLRSPDGSIAPRPSLSSLAARQPLLALRCAWSELPEWVKPLPPSRAGSAAAAGVSGLLTTLGLVRVATAIVAVVAVLAGSAVALHAGVGAVDHRGSALVLWLWLGTTAISALDLIVLGVRYRRRPHSLAAGVSWRDVRAVAIAGAAGPLVLVVGAVVALQLILLGASALLGALERKEHAVYIYEG